MDLPARSFNLARALRVATAYVQELRGSGWV